MSIRKLETGNYCSGNREPACSGQLACGASSGAGFRWAGCAPSPGGDARRRARGVGVGARGGSGRAAGQGAASEFLVLIVFMLKKKNQKNRLEVEWFTL